MATTFTPPVARTLSELLPRNDGRANETALVIPPSGGGSQSAKEGGSSLTYAALNDAVNYTAALLVSLGIKPGQSVAMSLVNGMEFVTAFLAATRLSAIAAPLNPKYTIEENKFYLKDMDCELLLVPEGGGSVATTAARELGVRVAEIRWEWTSERSGRNVMNRKETSGTGASSATIVTPAAALPPLPQPSDVALILHTSGTTSLPKAVPLSHGNICRTLTNISTHYQLTPQDRCMIVMPLFHVHGLIGCLLSSLLVGGCLVVPPRFSAGVFWKEFGMGDGCTWYSAVPTIHHVLLIHEGKNPSTPSQRRRLRFIRSCSSALDPTTWHQLERTFHVPIVEAYAMTEASHQMTSNPLPPAKRKPGSVGRGTGVEVKILDSKGQEVPQGQQGEVCIRGSNVTEGYRNNPEANKASFHQHSGFFRTGDQGYMDADGYIFLTGRLKELINRGGEKLSPLEIDSALLSCPLVSEAVAFGVPSEKYGQEVSAGIVLKADAWSKLQQDTSGEESRRLTRVIQQHARTKIADFKVPSTIHFSASLPKTATGKIQRRHVAAFFMKQQEEANKNKNIPSKL